MQETWNSGEDIFLVFDGRKCVPAGHIRLFFYAFHMSKWFHAAGRNYGKFQNKKRFKRAKNKNIYQKKAKRNKQTKQKTRQKGQNLLSNRKGCDHGAGPIQSRAVYVSYHRAARKR